MKAETKLKRIAAIYERCTKVKGNHWMSTHARHNLLGAYIDLERRGADKVCLRTIKRVMGQLARMERYLELPRPTKRGG